MDSRVHVEHLMINKDTLQEFVHLVGLLIYTYVCVAQYVNIVYTGGKKTVPSGRRVNRF